MAATSYRNASSRSRSSAPWFHPATSPLILELGCGAGVLARSLLELFPQATVYGYDGSPAMLEHARRALSNRPVRPGRA
jgi:trans-aconitate methyltransferase